MGLPRHAAASTRTGFGGPLDKTPVQAARASQMPSGVHCGVAAEKRDMSRPAASNKRFQSGGGTVPDSLSTCGGTASNSSRRPCGSSITETMPETMGGGSPGSTVPNGNASGTSGRGLWRYQNRIAGGCMLPNRCSQRPGVLAVVFSPGCRILLVFRLLVGFFPAIAHDPVSFVGMREGPDHAVFHGRYGFRRGAALFVAVLQENQPPGIGFGIERLEALEIGGHLLAQSVVLMGRVRTEFEAPQSLVILQPLRIRFRGEPRPQGRRHARLQFARTRAIQSPLCAGIGRRRAGGKEGHDLVACLLLVHPLGTRRRYAPSR